MKKLILIALVCSSLTGCFSLGEHIDNRGCPEDYYQGTQKAAELGMWVYLPWLDVPFSAVMDTVLLPVDAICHL
ncbi:YceK/YidQ family lipoprotein [Ewingella americana]|uniref:YceK/YidQ family lipoprotein n=1 Tax=Ewingella americana TaxID=41202 RepID=A0A502GJG8_9GAMM|nr:YceK/YidQ family lipoprotein [Ewingella americana]TPG61974.1 YceK/YidQ family lipoprotein [Ewingella americana]